MILGAPSVPSLKILRKYVIIVVRVVRREVGNLGLVQDYGTYR